MRKILSMIAIMACVAACEKPTPDPEPAKDTRSLILSPEKVSLAWDDASCMVNVTANFAYTVKSDMEWLVLNEAKTTSTILYFDVAANKSLSTRSATITVTDKADKYYNKSVGVTQGVNPNPETQLSIVDKNATAETKALFANLYLIGSKGFMFGHHDDLWYGRHWYNEAGRSDTKEVCGDYPAVFSVDFGSIAHDGPNTNENLIRRRVILEARERGEVVIAVMHINNPLTGKDSWDNSNTTVAKEILTEGSATRTKYTMWLDRLADFAGGLKDSKGRLVPVILRPYHEHTQEWSWWGRKCTTQDEFIALWRFTVEYLRDKKGVHNFLYAVSPQLDSWYTAEEAYNRIIFRWPGDNYVDFLGMDCYQGLNPGALKGYLDALESVAEKKSKPCGITEDGQEGFTLQNYWSTNVVAPLKDRRCCMVVMWRNKYVGTNDSDKHYYSVYPGHSSEDDFKAMYALPETFFSKDLPDMYTMPEGVTVN